MELTLDLLREWELAYSEGVDLPENVMMEIFRLAAERLTELES